MRNRHTALSIAALLAFGLAAGVASAQSPVAAVSGEGKPGDVAIIENPDFGVSREVEVKANGRYVMRNLVPGNYRVTIRHADGTKDEPKLITLRVGSTARVK